MSESPDITHEHDNYALAMVHVYTALNAVNSLFCDRLEGRASHMRRSKTEKSISRKQAHVERVGEIAATAQRRFGVVELDEVPNVVDAYRRFLKAFVINDYFSEEDYASAIAYKTALECLPFVKELGSIAHIARAHSDDAMRRSQKIETEVKSRI
jgi:hypothetical protein